MGFIKSITYNDLPISGVYHRVDVTQSADGQCTAFLNSYVSRDSYKNGSNFLKQEKFEFPILYGENVGSDKNQAYLYIRKLDEFTDAVDVYE